MMLLALLLFLAASTTSHSVRLNWKWQANSAPATQFQINRGPALTGPFHKIANVPLSTLTYLDTNVTVRKDPYCYEVIALGSKGNSQPSAVACTKIP